MTSRRGPREVRVDVAGLNGEAQGEGQVDGKRIALRNALPGETVTGRILKRRKGVLYGDGIEVAANASGERVASACTAFPRCGGCALHHLDYARQLDLKQQMLARELQAAGVQPERWRAPVSEGQLHYRTKARLGVRQVGERVLVGFRESFSNRVARLSTCLSLTPELAALLVPLQTTIGALSGADRVPQVEVAQGEDGVAIIVRHLDAMHGDDVDLWRAFQQRHGVQVLLQPGGYETVHGLDDGPVRLLSYQLPRAGVVLRFDPRQFTQVNFAVNASIVDAVLAYLDGTAGPVADLFCGIGNFSLPLARRGLTVHGYELAPDAVARAAENAQLNGVAARTTFEVANLYDGSLRLPSDVSSLVLDPPRSGAGEALSDWVQSPALTRIAYVSCNPVTFAADAARIVAAGFSLEAVGAYDMFPYTAHVETLGVFRRA